MHPIYSSILTEVRVLSEVHYEFKSTSSNTNDQHGILNSEDWQEYSTYTLQCKCTYTYICADSLHIACMHICAQEHIYTNMLAQMHNCTHLCRHAHINAHSGTKNVHA